jgi:hypothetical protein
MIESYQVFIASMTALGAENKGDEWTLTIDGRKLTARFNVASRGGPICADVAARGAFGAGPKGLECVRVREKTGTDSLGVALRINRPVLVGDERFDDEYYIDTDCDPALARATLDAPVRAAITALMGAGVTVALYDGPSLVSASWGFERDAELSEASLRARFEQLVKLASMLAHDAQTRATRDKSAVGAVAIVAPVVGIAAIVQGSAYSALVDSTAPTMLGFFVGIALGVALAAALASLVRGRTNSMDSLALPLTVLVFCCAITGPVALPALNVLLDTSEPTVARTRVTEARLTQSRNRSLNVTLAPVREGGSPVRLVLSTTMTAIFATGAPVRLNVHRGRFGWEWFDQPEREQPERR